MTLQEQHEKAMIESSNDGMFELSVTEAAAKVSKEYAKGFALWKDKNYFNWNDNEYYAPRKIERRDEVYTMLELLSLYDERLAKLEKEKTK